MSKVREYFRLHRPSWYVRLCEGLVKLLTGLLISAGFAIIAYSVFVLVAWSIIKPSGEKSNELKSSTLPAQSEHVSVADEVLPTNQQLPPQSLRLLQQDAPAQHTQPYLIYAFLGSGGGTVLASLAGFLGASLRSLGALNTFIFLQCLLLTYQTCLSILSFEKSDWWGMLPPEDGSPQIEAFIEARVLVFKVGTEA